MASKAMVHLYYTSKRACREDCDTLGIDRRRVISLRNGHTTMAGFDENGNAVFKPCVAKLKVSQDLVDKHLDELQHDDDETWS